MSDGATATEGFVEHSIVVGTRSVRYEEAGSGRPIVVLHRAGGLTRSPAHESLARSYRVVLIEMPGFGSSEPDEESATTRDYAEQVYRIASELAGTPFLLVGSSFGGRVAAWIAADHENDVEALALLAPGVFLPPSFELPRAGSQAREIRLYAHPERHVRPAPDLKVVAKQLDLVRRLLTPDDAGLEAAMAALALPVLVAFGTEDEVLPPSLGRRYVELNRSFFLSFVYDAGHALDEERPEVVASLLSTFFEHPRDHHVGRGDGRLFP